MSAHALNQILIFLSGLILFLIGVMKLSIDMQRLFGARIRHYIKYSVKKPIYGAALGTITTILFQSSSATTVLTVGIVSAGLISFFNSLGVILGADIGTTFTAQLVAWKITAISPIFVIFGGLLWLLAKNKLKVFGEILFNFGLIFFGLNLLVGTVEPLKESQFLMNLLKEAENPWLGLAIGFILTSTVHASAIPISILIILGHQGLMGIESALPIVLGANIGTTTTALLAAMGTNVNGRRSAFAHFLFKFFGVIILLPFLSFYISILRSLSQNPSQQIVYGHLLFNLLLFFLFIFWLKPFASLVKKIIPGEEKILSLWPEFLDEKYITQPPIALSSARKELKREILLAQKMFLESCKLISNFKSFKMRDINYIELVVDNLQTEIARYLWKISRGKLSPEKSKELFSYAAMVDDIERIADHALNIVSLAKYKFQRKAKFSEDAEKDLKEIQNLAAQNLEDAVFLIEEKNEEKIKNIFEREDRLDSMVKEVREFHLERFHKGICQAEAGPIFIDVLINLERISDHCENIAEYLEELD